MAAIFRKLFSLTPENYIALPYHDDVITPKPTYFYVNPVEAFNTNIVKMSTTTKNNIGDTPYVKIFRRYYKIVVDDDIVDDRVMFDSVDILENTKIDIEPATVVPVRKVLVNVIGMKFTKKKYIRRHLDGLAVNDPCTEVKIISFKSDVVARKNDIIIIDSSTIICCPNIKHSYGGWISTAVVGTNAMTAALKGSIVNRQLANSNYIIGVLYKYSDEVKKVVSYTEFDEMSDAEIANKLTSVFKDAPDELYIIGLELIIQYINKNNFNVFLFNHMRKVMKGRTCDIVIQYLSNDTVCNFR